MRVPPSPVVGDATVVRRATERDADLLVGWHADPDVARYWDGETFTREEMLLRLRRTDVDPYIIESEDEPIGYIQAWFEEANLGVVGLDMFLTPSWRDRGLGPDAARALAGWLLGVGGMHRVAVDPYLSNERAVRGWAKAGFQRIEERAPDEDHTQPWVLMVMDS